MSVVLENSGSVARDHLASERTFLAYVRTSLALSSAGVGELGIVVVISINPPKHWCNCLVWDMQPRRGGKLHWGHR